LGSYRTACRLHAQPRGSKDGHATINHEHTSVPRCSATAVGKHIGRTRKPRCSSRGQNGPTRFMRLRIGSVGDRRDCGR
jgi:hypothetical protein